MDVAPRRDRSQVVDAMGVIRVLVREQHGIDARDARAEQLESELGWRVDEDHRAAVRLHDGTDARPLVTWIRRTADCTVASELWNAEAGPRAEEGELHRPRAAARRHLIPSRPS